MPEGGDEHGTQLLHDGLPEEMVLAYAVMVVSVKVCLHLSSYYVF